MKPNFGSGLRNELFQNINLGTLNELEFRIQSDLEIYFPSLQITNVNVQGDTDTNLINVSINFKVRDTLVEDEININFE
jgi:phage baseplate assembly protein W